MALSTRKPGQHRLRLGRASESGQIYLVTTATFERRPHFSAWNTASFMSARINDSLLWQPDARLLCWVLMPDHWHGLIELNEGGDLSRVMQRAKGRTARWFGDRFPGRGRLWANAFHDRGIRREQDLLDVARYVIANPVRAGLVRRVGDYPFWNAVWI